MPTDSLNRTFAALAHPARRAMLARLSRGEASVGELAAPLRLSLPAVSRHLKVLERSGLIRRGRQAQRRPCRLEARPLKEAGDWVEQHRAQWEQRLGRLADFLERTHAPAAKERRRAQN